MKALDLQMALEQPAEIQAQLDTLALLHEKQDLDELRFSIAYTDVVAMF